MNDFLTSLIRTYVPIIVGSFVGFLAAHGLSISPEAEAQLTAFLGALFAAVYYLIVRLLERKFPRIGVLLGSAKKPEYTESK